MKKCMSIEMRINLGEAELQALQKEVERQREWMRKRGREETWTEKDELIYAVQRRLNELKVRHGEEVYDASYNRDFRRATPVTGEIRGGTYCREMVCSSEDVRESSDCVAVYPNGCTGEGQAAESI